MEFPYLGEHCSFKECHRLDFLPVKCQYCKEIFCGDHFTASKHNCPNEDDHNNQVPMCPICNKPIPKKLSESADQVVSLHIDQNCEIKREKVYKNSCNVSKCKKRELIPFVCERCNLNHCLTHRYPTDHNCTGPTTKNAIPKRRPTVQGTINSLARTSLDYFQNVRSNVTSNLHSSNSSTNGSGNSQPARPVPIVSTAAKFQGELSEDEALQIAIQESLNQGNSNNNTTSPSHSTNKSLNCKIA